MTLKSRLALQEISQNHQDIKQAFENGFDNALNLTADIIKRYYVILEGPGIVNPMEHNKIDKLEMLSSILNELVSLKND